MTATLYDEISELVHPFSDEGNTLDPVRITPNGAILVDNGHIVAVGPSAEINQHPLTSQATKVSMKNQSVVPGLVDSHTHVVFAGHRMNEMAMRTRGETYESIARAGGGIVNSARDLQEKTLQTLVDESKKRIKAMLHKGCTTLEIKTGYGLLPELEFKQLKAIDNIRASSMQSVYATALAHVIPPSWKNKRSSYLEHFCRDFMEAAKSEDLIDFCDVFVEATAWTPHEAAAIAKRAKQVGLGLKLHVDQLGDGQGAELAANLHALSADHLEYTSLSGAKALAQAGVVATILPGCKLFLGSGPWPNGRQLRDAGCEVAVATDCNPGSSMITDLPLCGMVAATQCGLSLEEALWAITRGGAKALGLSDRGTLQPGERADFVVLNDPDWRSLFYYTNAPPIHQVYIKGQAAFT